jgi:hypothetical protein
MQSTADSVEQYLAELPPERRAAIEAVRRVILERLPAGYEERMQSGMIGYVVPLERYPKTYNKQPLAVAALASQKHYMSLYLMGVYGDESAARWLGEQYRARGMKLDMGKSCVRFKRIEDVPLDVVGEAIARTPLERFIEIYEASRRS